MYLKRVSFQNLLLDIIKTQLPRSFRREWLCFCLGRHSFCVQILRRDAELVGLQKDFNILDESNQKSIIKELLLDPEYELFEIEEVVTFISDKKNTGISSDQALLEAKTIDDADLAQLYNQYEIELSNKNSLDFDDLLLFAQRLLDLLFNGALEIILSLLLLLAQRAHFDVYK